MDSFQKWVQATTCIGGCNKMACNRGADVTKHYCAFQKRKLWSLRVAFTIAFFTAVNHNYDHKQRTLKHRNTQNGSKFTNHKSQRNLPFKPVEVNYSLLRGPLRWMTTAKKCECQLVFELQNSRVCEKRIKTYFFVAWKYTMAAKSKFHLTVF